MAKGSGTRETALRGLPSLRATYRVQVNAQFTLPRLREVVPYMDRLGISHVYSSPLFAAAKGSMHGYDVIDPTRLNPEVGSLYDLRGLAADLHGRGMGLMLDIVPNHMSTSGENARWSDVLARGRDSIHAHWFDIDWTAPDADGKVILAVLGDTLDRAIERRNLRVVVDEHTGQPALAHFDARFPLRTDRAPRTTDLSAADIRALLDLQHYRLASWREATVNYRRFFDVDALVALRMEDPRVFDETHETVLDWIEEGLVDGLRIDHVDGLRDPLDYLRRLRSAVDARAGRRGAQQGEFPIVVEKILAADEELRAEWPVHGTTGYEFLNDLEDLFVDPAGFTRIKSAYRAMAQLDEPDFDATARAGKRFVLQHGLAPDLARVERAVPVGAGDRTSADAIAELITAMPVYRTYIDAEHIDRPDARDAGVLATAARRTTTQKARALAAALSGTDGSAPNAGGEHSIVSAEFVSRFQQLSGPAAARGIEDTALYVYVPLASRNEVGGAPDRDLGRAVERFHRQNTARAERWPLGLICTDTHDTKHGADVRSRLEAASSIAPEWNAATERWRTLNAPLRRDASGGRAPDPNTEYLFYQMLIGLWPAPAGSQAANAPPTDWLHEAAPRLRAYLRKASREAKRFTGWTDPDDSYESAVDAFVDATLDSARDQSFLEDVARFVARIADMSFWINAARTLLHLTAPGTPDIYQGTERSSAFLVDPDNRRPVDYQTASRALDRAETSGPDESLRLHAADPGARVRLTARVLGARRAVPDLFASGEYLPLEPVGARADDVVAFARLRGDQCAVVAVSRLLGGPARESCDAGWWGDTRLRLPGPMRAASRHESWRDVLSSRRASLPLTTLGEVEIGRLFSKIPLAFLTASTTT